MLTHRLSSLWTAALDRDLGPDLAEGEAAPDRVVVTAAAAADPRRDIEAHGELSLPVRRFTHVSHLAAEAIVVVADLVLARLLDPHRDLALQAAATAVIATLVVIVAATLVEAAAARHLHRALDRAAVRDRAVTARARHRSRQSPW